MNLILNYLFQLNKYTARVYTADEDTIVLRPNDQGLPSFRIKAKDLASAEVVRKAWLKDVNEMQDEYCKSIFTALGVTMIQKNFFQLSLSTQVFQFRIIFPN